MKLLLLLLLFLLSLWLWLLLLLTRPGSCSGFCPKSFRFRPKRSCLPPPLPSTSDLVSPFAWVHPYQIIASCGFDASYMDPLARLCLGSKDFENITKTLAVQANIHSEGRLVMVHEGGQVHFLSTVVLRVLYAFFSCFISFFLFAAVFFPPLMSPGAQRASKCM